MATAHTSGLIAMVAALAFSLVAGPRPPSATCRLFLLMDCPVAQSYAPEIARIAKTYARRDVRFELVFEDTDAKSARVAGYCRAYHLSIPFRIDTAHRLAKKLRVAAVPTAVVTGPGEALVYRGRIDDTFVQLGVRRSKPLHHDLREALDSLAAGRRPIAAETRVIGCAFGP